MTGNYNLEGILVKPGGRTRVWEDCMAESGAWVRSRCVALRSQEAKRGHCTNRQSLGQERKLEAKQTKSGAGILRDKELFGQMPK